MTAVGDGKMDFEPMAEAAADHVQWMIVELDRCATDMFTAVEASSQYLRNKGFTQGT